MYLLFFGKNGDGKSSLVEIILRIINNFGYARTELLCLQLEKLPLSAEHALEMVSFC